MSAAREAVTMPGCGRPATSWIGMYAPGQATVYGDLKATLYVCEAHAVDGVEAAHKLDLTPHCFPNRSAVSARCGAFYDYRAGAVRPAPEAAHTDAESGTPVPDRDADVDQGYDCFETKRAERSETERADRSTIEALHRIAERLADADQAAQRAYARGYVVGVRDRLAVVHAWKVARVDGDRGEFVWTCRCGQVEHQPEGVASVELVDRLRAHCAERLETKRSAGAGQ